MQSVLRLIFPSRCLICGEFVEGDAGLCGPCWRDTPFLAGLCCDLCGVPLPGESDAAETCDECRKTARPWSQGRAVLLYKDNGRKLVLSLKHGDRLDLVKPMARWMVRAGRDLLRDDVIVTCVPLHWMRLAKRRYNQSAELARHFARLNGAEYCPDLLLRKGATPSLDGKTKDQRFEVLSGKIQLSPKRADMIKGRPVLIIDDVMTSGATLAACSEACLGSQASEVCVLTLARVAKDA
ncbi:MAG: ComF family protein [Pseudoruegeria sp.]